MSGTSGALRRALDALYLWAGYAAGVFLVTIFVLMIVMSAGREVGVNVPAGDDFTAWSMVAMAFLGMAHTFKRGEMIRVGLLTERLKGRAKWLAELFSLVVALLFVGYFFRHVAQMAHDSWRFNDLAQGVVAFPLWIPQTVMATGLGILLIAVLDEVVRVLGGQKPSYEKEPPRTTEELIERVAEGGGV